MHIFGHSEFIPVFLGKIVGKNLEWPFLAIKNLYQSFWEKLLEKIWNSHFWQLQIYLFIFGKNCQKKIQCDHFWPFQIYTSIFGFLGKIVRKNLEWPFWAILKFF